jgi:hypothetical protein
MRSVHDGSGNPVTPSTIASVASKTESEYGVGYRGPRHRRCLLGEEEDAGQSCKLRCCRAERNSKRTWARAPGHETRCPSRARHDRPQDAVTLPARQKPASHQYRPWTPSIPAAGMAVMLLFCVLLQPVAAVKVPFENCLPDSYRLNQPTLLQWLPYRVDAWFDTENTKHTLTMTMWGNVTGSLYNVTLPPPDSPAWQDPKKLDGKILGEPEPDSDAPKLTTLHSKINFLTYEPWSDNTNFCNTSLTNATCPLGPIFDTTDLYVGLSSGGETRRKLTVDLGSCHMTSRPCRWHTISFRHTPLLRYPPLS